MKFTKPAFSYEAQADLVIGRGLIADRARLIRRLQSVGYYRLCGYWHHLKDDREHFKPRSDFETVWQTYNFDRRLRMIVMEAIERIEVAIRCDIYTELVMRHGPFVHCDPANFPNAKPARPPKLDEHAELLNRLRDEARRSREPFVLHFKERYDEFPDLPLWAAAQIMSFGSVISLVNMSASDIRPKIAAKYGVHDVVFASWLLTLNLVRNICAHHSRLWNREIALKPRIPFPKNAPEWHNPFPVANNRVFAVLSMLRVLQSRIAPRSQWRERVFALFDDFGSIPLAPMGMPPNWRTHAIWR